MKSYFVLDCGCREYAVLFSPEDIIIIEDGKRVEVDKTCPECSAVATAMRR